MNTSPIQVIKKEFSISILTLKRSSEGWWKAWPEWVLILIVVLLFCHGILNVGTSQALPGSEAQSFELDDQVLLNSLHYYGQFPQWNPYLLGGLPFVRSHVPHVIFFTLRPSPGIMDGNNVALFLAILLAAYGAWWLARNLGMGPAGRVWCACVYAFAGQPAIRFNSGELLLVFGFAWIPWTLAALIKAVETRRKKYVLLSVISLALLYFSGNIYYAVFILVFIGLLALVYIPETPKKKTVYKAGCTRNKNPGSDRFPGTRAGSRPGLPHVGVLPAAQ